MLRVESVYSYCTDYQKNDLKTQNWLTWIILSCGCAFLAMDDKFIYHENLDKAIHSLFKWQETKLSDRIDDIIVAFTDCLE